MSVQFMRGQEIFLSSQMSMLSLGPTQPPIQWVLWATFTFLGGGKGQNSGQGMKLATHLYQRMRLRMNGTVPLPPPPYALLLPLH
jgi:hypothetical protein